MNNTRRGYATFFEEWPHTLFYIGSRTYATPRDDCVFFSPVSPRYTDLAMWQQQTVCERERYTCYLSSAGGTSSLTCQRSMCHAAVSVYPHAGPSLDTLRYRETRVSTPARKWKSRLRRAALREIRYVCSLSATAATAATAKGRPPQRNLGCDPLRRII